MPLAATHIKFALDTKESFHIKDIGKYLSGTIYPDSRYLTKINRELTHGKYLLSPDFATDDFKKGWAAHYICDKSFNQVSDKTFPEFFTDRSNTSEGSEWWITKTAIKNILDLQQLNKFDIKPFLPLLDYVENPNHESLESIKQFNQFVQNLYSSSKLLTLEDFEKVLLEMGVDQKLANKVTLRARQLIDSDSVAKISGLYGEMLR